MLKILYLFFNKFIVEIKEFLFPPQPWRKIIFLSPFPKIWYSIISLLKRKVMLIFIYDNKTWFGNINNDMKKLCVIFGGASSEHDISIITAMQLKKNLEKIKPVEMIYLGLNNKFYLATKTKGLEDFENKNFLKFKEICIKNNKIYAKNMLFKEIFEIECVINCCHGGVGEDGKLAGFFDLNNISYTSSNTISSEIAMNKFVAKSLLKDEVNVVEAVLVSKENFEEKTKFVEQNFSSDLIVKPNSMGSSIGVKACNKSNFKEQIFAVFEMGDLALVEERVVDLVEYNQACFKDGEELVLSAIEKPMLKGEVLSFDDKYIFENKTKGKDREVPAKIPKKLEQEISSKTKKIYSQLGMNGVVRIDYIYDKRNNILYFNEINAIPGSMAFYLYEPIGVDYISLIEKLINNATKLKPQKYFPTDVLKHKNIWICKRIKGPTQFGLFVFFTNTLVFHFKIFFILKVLKINQQCKNKLL